MHGATIKTTKFICYYWYTNFSDYNYMFRPVLVAIIRLYIPSFKSFFTSKPTRLCLMMRSLSSEYTISYAGFLVDFETPFQFIIHKSP